MSDHHNDHSNDHHEHNDHGHHGSDYVYFDESTNILVPVFIIVALVAIFGLFFFG